MSAILFGSISTVADTSEMQREAFNEAFRAHGLDWSWCREEYQPLLQSSGGEQRVADYAAERGEDVDAAAVHRTKSKLAQGRMAAGFTARPGVVETIKAAQGAGEKLALVTTTARENVDALLDGLDDVSAEDFDVIIDASSVEEPSPTSPRTPSPCRPWASTPAPSSPSRTTSSGSHRPRRRVCARSRSRTRTPPTVISTRPTSESIASTPTR